MSRRTDRLASVIQRELMDIIMRELSDPRLTGLPSITRVKVSGDLSIADVYVTIMGTDGVQTAGLNALRHSAGLMRSKLAKSLTLRTPPYLKFHLDEQLKKEMSVLEALRQIEREREAQESQTPQTETPTTDSAAVEPAPEPTEPTEPSNQEEQDRE